MYFKQGDQDMRSEIDLSRPNPLNEITPTTTQNDVNKVEVRTLEFITTQVEAYENS